jgi:hypothetical protein
MNMQYRGIPQAAGRVNMEIAQAQHGAAAGIRAGGRPDSWQ